VRLVGRSGIILLFVRVRETFRVHGEEAADGFYFRTNGEWNGPILGVAAPKASENGSLAGRGKNNECFFRLRGPKLMP
jgi:hypothetical protein